MDVTWSASEGLSPNFRSVGDHIYYYFVPDWPGMDATRSVSEGLEPSFRFVLLEKPAIGGGGIRSVIYWMWGDDTFQASLWGLGATHCPLPLTGSTSAHNNEDCKKDCGLDLQSHVKKGLQVGMQSILALGLRIWNAILLKRILMMPGVCCCECDLWFLLSHILRLTAIFKYV